MRFRIQLVAIEDDGTEHLQEIAALTRGAVSMETLRLTLEESKQMLQTLQQAITERQVAAYLAHQRACPHCGTQRRLKKSATAPFRTLFGLVAVPPLIHGGISAPANHTRRRPFALSRLSCPPAPAPSCSIWRPNGRPWRPMGSP